MTSAAPVTTFPQKATAARPSQAQNVIYTCTVTSSMLTVMSAAPHWDMSLNICHISYWEPFIQCYKSMVCLYMSHWHWNNLELSSGPVLLDLFSTAASVTPLSPGRWGSETFVTIAQFFGDASEVVFALPSLILFTWYYASTLSPALQRSVLGKFHIAVKRGVEAKREMREAKDVNNLEWIN